MNITQLINKQGNAVKNQFIVTTVKGQYFKSYDSLIAFKPSNGDTPVLTDSWNYSATTVKHLKTFLGCSLTSKQIADRIKSGSFILDNNLAIV